MSKLVIQLCSSALIINLLLNSVNCYPPLDGDTRPVLDEIRPADQTPIVGKEYSNPEFEGIPSKTLSIYDRGQKKYADILNQNARPIVDTIQEHEKYGNNGDKFYGAGRAIVNTYEGFANLINKAIDTPKTIARSISHSIADKLNQLGGRLVGL